MPSPSPRLIWIGLALACTIAVLASLTMTTWFSLDPCHLCIFQRLLFMILVLLAVAAAAPSGRSAARPVFGVLFAAVAAIGAGTAAYQSWLQAQTASSVSCVGGEPGPIELLVEWLGQQAPSLFLATGFCDDPAVVILGLSLANWALVAFGGCVAAAVWATRRAGR
jgi:protein dithiol:quinone oxidoreductase